MGKINKESETPKKMGDIWEIDNTVYFQRYPKVTLSYNRDTDVFHCDVRPDPDGPKKMKEGPGGKIINHKPQDVSYDFSWDRKDLMNEFIEPFQKAAKEARIELTPSSSPSAPNP